MKKKKKKMTAGKYILYMLLAIVLAIFAGTGVWAAKFLKQAENPWPSQTPIVRETPPDWWYETPDPDETPGTQTPSPSTPTPPIIDDTFTWGKDVVNILIMGFDGNDYREQSETYFRSDTLILATIYYNKNKVILTSIPRDSYVYIGPDFTHKAKINSASADAAVMGRNPYEAACETVERLFSGKIDDKYPKVPIDYYFAVDMDAFIEVIDVIGGIDYDVDIDIVYEYKGELQYKVRKGYQKLTGQMALDYVQFRNTADADIGRVARQRKFLSAAFAQMKSANTIMKLPEIYNSVIDDIHTNLTYAQIVNLAKFAADNLSSEGLEGRTFPGNFNGSPYWIINQKERRKLVYEMFGQTIKIDEQD